jgi:arylsulfatase A-like enzyme
MNRRDFLAAMANAALAGAAATAAHAPRHARAAGQGKRPNIIFIMADDLGQYDLGCCGGKHILTPHIDRIAAEGVRFTQVYAGSTVCAPSRSVLMTGRHTGHTTVRGNSAAAGGPPPQRRIPLNAEDVTVGEVLKVCGYTTGIVGKWGLGEPDTPGIPNKQGFDFWFGYLNQRHAHNYWTEYLWRNTEKVEFPGNSPSNRKVYSHDRMTKEALGFVRGAAEGSKPFFLYAAYTIPHGTLHPPDDKPYSDKPWSRAEKNYAAMVTRMDRDVGRLMALLKELAIDKNTIVFFCSDNGWTPSYCGPKSVFKSGGPLRGNKGNLYEGGIRVPMLVRWPGRIRPGTVSDQVWAFWDVLPTVAEIAGAEAPAGIDGISMLPAILGRKQERQHAFLYWEFRTSGFQQAVRWGDWKGIRHGTEQPLELYHLKDDLSEKRDVAKNHPEVVKRIERFMAGARTPSKHWPALPGRAKKKAKP